MALTQKQKIIRYVIYAVGGLVILALVGYFFVVRTIQIHNQKQNFAKAEASLDALEKQIEAKVGKPDDMKKEKSCDRANLKSGSGPLGCDVTVYLLYGDRSAEDSTLLMNSLLGFGDSNIRIGSGAAKLGGFIDKSTQKGEQTFYQNLKTDTTLKCAFSYTYPGTDHEAFSVTHSENFQIGLSCGGSAMVEFFPVNE